MRDPKRIDRILGQLRWLWGNNPDLRLGQLLSNASGGSPGEDIFFCLRDGDLEDILAAMIQSYES